MIRTTDRIAYPSRAQTADAIAGLRRILGSAPANAQAFLSELEAACLEAGLDFAILASHAANECSLFRDQRFQSRRDAFGIGKTGPSVEGAAFATYKDAARFAVSEYLLKLRLPLGIFADERVSYPEKFDRVKRLVASGDFPIVERIEDLNKPFGDSDFVWMADPDGPEAIVAKGRALFPELPDQSTEPIPEEGPMALTIVSEELLTSGPNYPGQDLQPGELWVTWHNNGVKGGSAFGERSFVIDDGGGKFKVSYHFAVDHLHGVQIMKLDKRAWHAGDNCDNPVTDTGCFRSIAIEIVETTDPAKWAQTKKNAIDLTIAIIAGDTRIVYGTAKGRFAASRIAPHQKWSGKYCPRVILDEGSLPGMIAAVAAGVAGPPKPVVVVPDPVGDEGTGKESTRIDKNGVPWVYSRRPVVPVRAVQTYKYADPTSGDGPILPAGKSVLAYYTTSVADPVTGKPEIWLTSRKGWRFRLRDALAA